MGSRLKSAIATALIQGAVVYGLIVGLALTIPPKSNETVSSVDLPPETEAPPQVLLPPPPKTAVVPYVPGLFRGAALKPLEWATAGALQREAAFIDIQRWRNDNMTEEDKRLARWRKEVPQGSGPGRVTRLRPDNLPTHTLYWPAKWSRGPLPIVVWGNGQGGVCANSSLEYAGFLAEIASHGYFVVAVGNDDIEYPQPEGLEILADRRPIRTQPSALRRAVDWAVAENGRGGSPYAGRLNTSKIAYMGHGCGGGQAMIASSDPRTTTTVLLNAAAVFRPEATTSEKPPVAHFEGRQDDRTVIEAGDANFARAQAASWPMYKAALNGMGHTAAYDGPDRRWSRAVLAWLNWRLKGDRGAEKAIEGLARNGWSRVEATWLTPEPAPAATPEPAPAF